MTTWRRWRSGRRSSGRCMSTKRPGTYSAEVQAIRESFGRVVYSHKTHEKAREIQSRRASLVKWVNILLATATSTTY